MKSSPTAACVWPAATQSYLSTKEKALPKSDTALAGKQTKHGAGPLYIT